MSTLVDSEAVGALARIAFLLSWRHGFKPDDELILAVGSEGNELPVFLAPGFSWGNRDLKEAARAFIATEEARQAQGVSVMSADAQEKLPYAVETLMEELRTALGVPIVVLRIGKPDIFEVTIEFGDMPMPYLHSASAKNSNVRKAFEEALNVARTCALGKEQVS